LGAKVVGDALLLAGYDVLWSIELGLDISALYQGRKRRAGSGAEVTVNGRGIGIPDGNRTVRGLR
jgi:hypothetical protein